MDGLDFTILVHPNTSRRRASLGNLGTSSLDHGSEGQLLLKHSTCASGLKGDDTPPVSKRHVHIT